MALLRPLLQFELDRRPRNPCGQYQRDTREDPNRKPAAPEDKIDEGTTRAALAVREGMDPLDLCVCNCRLGDRR
jgi:hypothetical protein